MTVVFSSSSRVLFILACAAFLALGCGDSDNGNGGGAGGGGGDGTGAGGGGGAGEVSDSLRQAFDEALCRMQCTDQVICEDDLDITFDECMAACPNPMAPEPPHVTLGRNNAACMNAGIAYFNCEVDEGCDAAERDACDDEQRDYSQTCR